MGWVFKVQSSWGQMGGERGERVDLAWWLFTSLVVSFAYLAGWEVGHPQCWFLCGWGGFHRFQLESVYSRIKNDQNFWPSLSDYLRGLVLKVKKNVNPFLIWFWFILHNSLNFPFFNTVEHILSLPPNSKGLILVIYNNICDIAPYSLLSGEPGRETLEG